MTVLEWTLIVGVVVLFVGGVYLQGVDLFPLPEIYIALLGGALVRWQMQVRR